MLILGLAGGLDPVHEARLDAPENFTYDGAAVLVEDGTVVAAVEESRVDRIRRSNKFPVAAIQFCLEQRGVRLEEVDRIAYYAQEEVANGLLSRLYLAMPEIEQRLDARGLLASMLHRELGCEVAPSRLRFFPHKLTHAAGALAHSGFDEALVLILDNSGGLFRGYRREGGALGLEELVPIPPAQSTTRLLQTLLPFLGLGPLDDHRAVAMAQHGDPTAFRPLFRTFYELLPGGSYTLRLDRVVQLVAKIEPRGKQGPGQQHRDLAAALQEAQEEIVLHLLRHQREATGLRNLCMAGGIVENSATNGKVLSAGLFDDIFVHPAAHDAGCALGAALLACEEAGSPLPRRRLAHVDWGRDAALDAATVLERWDGFLACERLAEVPRRTAELLARGELVGWVLGRSQFSSRSLGNRSVLADPRPVENRGRVDAALHRSPDSVPVAASVLEEDAGALFELPDTMSSFPYMAFTVKARESGRALGAVVQRDGTVWLHTVTRESNPWLWELLHAFKSLTGVPALFNTSFSSVTEPVVESAEDAVAAFLTTSLDHLVVDGRMVSKGTPTREDRLALQVALPPYVRLQRTRGFVGQQQMGTSCQVRTTYDARLSFPVSSTLFDLLMKIDEDERPLGELLAAHAGDAEGEQALLAELERLWAQRLVQLRGGRGATASLPTSALPAGAQNRHQPLRIDGVHGETRGLDRGHRLGRQ